MHANKYDRSGGEHHRGRYDTRYKVSSRYDNRRSRSPELSKYDSRQSRSPEYSRYDNRRSRSPEYSRYDNRRSRSPGYSRYDNRRSRSPEYSRYNRRSRSPEYSRYDNRQSRSPEYSRYDIRRSRSPEFSRYDNRRSRTPEAHRSYRSRERSRNRDSWSPERHRYSSLIGGSRDRDNWRPERYRHQSHRSSSRENDVRSKSQERYRHRNRQSTSGGDSKTESSNQREEREIVVHKVYIANSKSQSKEHVISLLEASIGKEFCPIGFAVEGESYIFYVDNNEDARKIINLDNKIRNWREDYLRIKVESDVPPTLELSAALRNSVQKAIQQKYDIAKKSLDLTRFHRNEELVNTVFFSLTKPNCANAALNTIGDYLPQVVCLKLSCNGIRTLEDWSILPKKTPNLKVLILDDNLINFVSELDHVKELPLQELSLRGNPCCYGSMKYKLALQKVFPKLEILDGVPFSESFYLPSSKEAFMCAEDGRIIVKQFLEEYYSMFDARNRIGLWEAYHDQALFSVSSAKLHSDKETLYQKQNRNLEKIKDPESRITTLKQGKKEIVKFLSELPRTYHDPLSLGIDLLVYKNDIICVSVNGVFREQDSVVELRAFNRVFVLFPNEHGFCIVNDILFITSPTITQRKHAFHEKSAVVQNKLIDYISTETKMNHEWSKKFLEESSWDADKAINKFNDSYKAGKVPDVVFDSSVS